MARQIQKWLGAFSVLLVAGAGLVVPQTVCAEPLTVGLADNHVEITTGFTGTNLVLFGSKQEKGDVVVVLEGPERSSIVRRKERILGAWINSAWLEFDIPSYYDYALSVESEAEILSEPLLQEKRVGLASLKVEPEKARYDADTIKVFQDAMIRSKQGRSLFPKNPQAIEFLSDSLFRVNFDLPSNVPSGEYTVRALLVNKGKIVYEQSKAFDVGLEGFSSDIFVFARDQSLLYGLVCVLIAFFIGWLSDAIVRRN